MTLNSEGLEKALPCVFCQGEIFLGEVQRPDGIGGWKKSGYRASCRSCEMSMKEAKSEAEAIAAWNRRALPPVDGLEVVAWLGTNLDGESEPFLEQRQAEFWSNGACHAEPLVTLASLQAMQARAETAEGEYEKVLNSYADENQRLSDRAEAAEARISSLEEEDKRLREAIDEIADFDDPDAALDPNVIHLIRIAGAARRSARQTLGAHNG